LVKTVEKSIKIGQKGVENKLKIKTAYIIRTRVGCKHYNVLFKY
jgi:hypothetical protein